jgi:hypothetical protein
VLRCAGRLPKLRAKSSSWLARGAGAKRSSIRAWPQARPWVRGRSVQATACTTPIDRVADGGVQETQIDGQPFRGGSTIESNVIGDGCARVPQGGNEAEELVTSANDRATEIVAERGGQGRQVTLGQRDQANRCVSLDSQIEFVPCGPACAKAQRFEADQTWRWACLRSGLSHISVRHSRRLSGLAAVRLRARPAGQYSSLGITLVRYVQTCGLSVACEPRSLFRALPR